MKINIDKTKEMITIFANLSEESQDTLLAEAYKLEINQNIEKQVISKRSIITRLASHPSL